MAEKYSKPPIVEAIIEAKFAPTLPDKQLRRLIDAAKHRYSHAEDQVEVEFSFSVEASQQAIKQNYSGAKLVSVDGTDALILGRESIIVSRIAPYAGWTALRARADQELDCLRQFAPDRRFTRLGVRYINRIDIPLVGSVFSPEPYLTLFPQRPSILSGAAIGYAIQLAGCPVGDYMVNVNTGITPPQLIDHGALLVDVDAFVERDMDYREIGKLLEGVRDVKNEVFEGLITDQARELFS